ncbi:SDR family oxidoreductase [Corynebacterium hylobatis]|uniref:3-oxoacyl-[acyl-carrier-protein] reductase MabA n=1 Tax=Corynebacterium hylobatis TaxID=1859290 RepID=A0A430HY91_9CORY|nr:SDR family oxidoreductase [Corynebacterium hylobatis]RSZ63174.1 SDR family oxidoreductase [Corynebacterium hylobatis]
MAQRVLITAGAGGIGLEIARAFVREGAKVHVADINAEAVEKVTSELENVTGTVGDIADPAAADQILEDVRSHLGGLDVLVNNAGIAGPTKPITEYGEDDFDAVINVNLRGTFNVTKRAVPLLKESDAPSIITMSSLAGRFGYPNRIGYSTTKFALVGFAKTLARELGEFGITSNTIHPGAVAGPRMENVLQGRADISGRTLEEERESALANQAVQQFVDAADIAELVLFLAGPHARSISGQMLNIDGDSKAAV